MSQILDQILDQNQTTPKIKVEIDGNDGVGKSSIINLLKNSELSQKYDFLDRGQ
jgi:predicted GTPase